MAVEKRKPGAVRAVKKKKVRRVEEYDEANTSNDALNDGGLGLASKVSSIFKIGLATTSLNLSPHLNLSILEDDEGFKFRRGNTLVNNLANISEVSSSKVVPKKRSNASIEAGSKAKVVKKSKKKNRESTVPVRANSKLLDLTSDEEQARDQKPQVKSGVSGTRAKKLEKKSIQKVSDKELRPNDSITMVNPVFQFDTIDDEEESVRSEKRAKKEKKATATNSLNKNQAGGKPRVVKKPEKAAGSAVPRAKTKKGVLVESLFDDEVEIVETVKIAREKKITKQDVELFDEGPIKQPLQISESPVQKRNKELRNKGTRRSSLGKRGKRTSSVGNGFQVAPHPDVPASGFYKHLDVELPEPHRMKQLLIWCLKRQTDEDVKKQKDKKGKYDSDAMIAVNITKVIKDEIVRDFIDGKINTSWWNRDQVPNDVEVKLVPNEKNVEIAKTIQMFEKRLASLKRENTQLDKLNKKYNAENQKSSLDIKLDESELGRKSRRAGLDAGVMELLTGEDPVGQLAQQAKDSIKSINNTMAESLNTLNDWADELKFNDSVTQNFEHNKIQHLTRIIRKYIETQTVQQVRKHDPDKSFTEELEEYQIDDIELLRGITRIDKG